MKLLKNSVAGSVVMLFISCGPDTSGTAESSGTHTTSGSDNGSSPDEGTVPDESADDAPSPSTTTPSVDESSGSVDEGPTGTEGGSGPDIPPLPAECDGDTLVSDVLQPEEVYLAGTLSEGACYRTALAHWSTPNDAVAGFDCYFNDYSATIRPTDGRLIYTNSTESLVREFHCDTCPITNERMYPRAPLRNDSVLSTPMCDPEDLSGVSFLLAPDGSFLYRCGFEASWFDEAGDVVHESARDPLVHLGYQGLALTLEGVSDLASGTFASFSGLPMGYPLAIRAVEDGFRVVMQQQPEDPELWHVAADGEATNLGTYSAAPEGHAAFGENSALDACGALFQIAHGPEPLEDVILRRELDGETHVVYTEAVAPVVKIHISRLVTGP